MLVISKHYNNIITVVIQATGGFFTNFLIKIIDPNICYRCPLASSLLLLLAAGTDPSTFPLIDPPPLDSVKASLQLLKEFGKF